MDIQQEYVIIGNGIAGVTAAETLRSADPSCSITIVADDPFPVYYRPGLKDFLAGRMPEEKLWARPRTFYSDQHIRFIRGRVIGIDPLQHCVQLQNGKRVGYSKLLLANGARPRQLACPGLNLEGASTLRTVTDYQKILQRLQAVRRAVVYGSGTLALESAETLRSNSYAVTHLMRGETLWSEVLDAIASEMVLQEERRDGIDVRTGEEIAEVVGKHGQVSGIITTSGKHIACEMVLIAIGIEPVLDFIQVSGIACGRGVKVDSNMRTNMQDIYAAGDVVETSDTFTGRTRVLGQWFPAISQARIAASSMLGLATQGHGSDDGTDSEFATADLNFYNATFLYGLDFVSVGLTTGYAFPRYAEVVAEPQPRSYRKVVLKDGIIVGALLLGDRRHGLTFKRAIDYRVKVSPIASRLFALNFDFDAWLDEQGVPDPIFDMENETGSTQSAQYAYRRESQETAASYGDSRAREAFLVPLAHPEIAVDVQEICLRNYATSTISVGRREDVSLRLAHNSVSRLHAEILASNGAYVLRDAGSSNGTFINGRRVARNAASALQHDDHLRFGDVQFRFELRSEATPKRPTAPRQQMPVGADLSRPAPIYRPPQDPCPAPQRSETKRVSILQPPPRDPRQLRRLSEERTQFEIDMCIGCNRCMDACPVPLSSQVCIAELNTGTVSDQVASIVADFTHECILCGSCVPVCPVDNHRDLLMMALKERVGGSWNVQPELQGVAAALPDGWTISMLMSRLREQPFLLDPQQVPDTYLLHILAASQQHILSPGEMVIREGDYGRDLYLVLEGRLQQMTSNIDNKALPVAILSRGEYVGEDGMLTGQPYKSSARAQTMALLLQVPEQVMQRLMELVPGVQQHFEHFNSARSLKSILKRMALFSGIADADIESLVRQTPVKQYERNVELFTEDRTGQPLRETLHVLLEGFVKVARRVEARNGESTGEMHILAYRQGGDYFAGGLDLLGDGHAVTVTTINRCRVAEVPRHVLLALFQRYPEVDSRFSQRLREYIETAVAMQGYAIATGALKHFTSTRGPVDPHVQAGLHALVKDGVVEGTEVLVIDLDKCIHCNECEMACERRHGHSRMNRKGMVVGNISIATACRQCQDPICMLCSRAGIARHPNGEVYITESCIGCGICAERCPYGAISIVQVDDTEPAHTSWQRFSSFFSGETSKERTRKNLPVVSAQAAGGSYAAPGPLATLRPRSGYDELRKKVAIKCDLCAGYSDQACVQACPMGAAIRVQPTTFFGSTEEILSRRAN